MRCPGVGPHTIRHLIATAIIKKTGEFNTAALVLHDREETVRKHYAHLLTEDGNTRYRSLFPSLFTG
jgi:integrase